MIIQKPQVDRETILRRFVVDLDAGRLWWRVPSKYHREKTGKEAGGPRPSRAGKEYWIIRLDGRAYRRGHLIYCVAHGQMPTPCIDHINGNSLDDRQENLREATITENAWNHKHRRRRVPLPMGVRLIPGSGRFEARISFHGKQLHLGSYATPKLAQGVYLAKRRELYGDFA